MSINNFIFSALKPADTNFYFISVQEELYQIYTDDNYIYAATATQLKIFDINNDNLYAYIPYNYGFTTVAGNSTYVYVGTTSSGIKKISKSCISGSTISPYNLSICLTDYVTSPSIEGNDIQYLHANDSFIGVISNDGLSVSAVKFDPQGYVSSTTIDNGKAKKCFITSTGSIYYTISGTTNWYTDVKTSILCDWTSPDYSYATADFMVEGLQINDIFITENTSNNHNTLFIATSSGLYIINEDTKAYNIYLEE